MSMILTAADGLALVISRVENASDLARLIELRPQAISKWKREGRVPLKRVPVVAEITGIPPHQIRPDLPQFFPPPKCVKE